MAIWVIKDGRREGPYEEQDVRELVYEGTYADSDPAIRDGQFDWSTLGELLRRTPPAAEEESPPVVETKAVPPELPPVEATAAPPVAGIPELAAAAQEPDRPIKVSVIDFQMPFGSMVMLMVKWVLAAIPALLILAAFGLIFWLLFLGLLSAAFHR